MREVVNAPEEVPVVEERKPAMFLRKLIGGATRSMQEQ
jgi:hypothetical protein